MISESFVTFVRLVVTWYLRFYSATRHRCKICASCENSNV